MKMKLTKMKVIPATVVAALVLSGTVAYAGQSGKGAGTNSRLAQSSCNGNLQNGGRGAGMAGGMGKMQSKGNSQGNGFGKLASILGVDTSGLDMEGVKEALNTAIKALDSDSLAEAVEKLGIETDGLTDEEIIASIEEKLCGREMARNGFGRSMLKEIAEELGISIDNVTPQDITEAISDALESLDSDALSKLAEKLEVETDGLSNDEIIAAIKERISNGPFGNGMNQAGMCIQMGKAGILGKIAEALNIDLTGLDFDEMKEAISTALEALDSDALSKLAENLGIDTEGLTDDEIMEKVENLISNGCFGKRAGGIGMIAKALDLDLTGLDFDEMKEAISTALEALDSDALSKLAENLGINTEGLTDDEIIEKVESHLSPRRAMDGTCVDF